MGGRLKIMLVCFALAAAIGVGCGSDDDTTTGGSGNGSSGSANEPGSGGASDGSANESESSESESGDSESQSGDSGGAPNDSADAGGATLSKAEFLAQGNQICLDVRSEIGEEIKALVQKEQAGAGAGLDTAEEIAEDIVLPHFKAQNEELRELPIPAGDEAEVEAFLDRLEAEVQEAEADLKVLLGAQVSPFLPARKLLSAYGLTKCGRI